MKPTTSEKPVIKRSAYHFKLNLPGDVERPKGKSLCVQDDAYTVRDLFEKFTRGMNVGLDRPTYFEQDQDHDDPDFSKIGDLDLVERQELLQGAREKASRQAKLLRDLQATPVASDTETSVQKESRSKGKGQASKDDSTQGKGGRENADVQKSTTSED